MAGNIGNRLTRPATSTKSKGRRRFASRIIEDQPVAADAKRGGHQQLGVEARRIAGRGQLLGGWLSARAWPSRFFELDSRSASSATSALTSSRGPALENCMSLCRVRLLQWSVTPPCGNYRCGCAPTDRPSRPSTCVRRLVPIPAAPSQFKQAGAQDLAPWPCSCAATSRPAGSPPTPSEGE